LCNFPTTHVFFKINAFFSETHPVRDNCSMPTFLTRTLSKPALTMNSPQPPTHHLWHWAVSEIPDSRPDVCFFSLVTAWQLDVSYLVYFALF